MTALLNCRGIDAGYAGGRPVVRGFDLTLSPGEVVTLLGPNGSGKTTIFLTLAGLIPWLGGDIEIDGSPVHKGRPREMAKRGLVLVPDDRSLFTSLSVKDNLVLGRRRGGPSLDQVLEYFPALTKRLRVAAGMLSGGEQQMLAIGRALMQRPRILLIDELSMGLAPVIVEDLLPIVRKAATDADAAVILVEQHVQLALKVSDRALVLVHGEITLQGDARDIAADPGRLERAYLGGGEKPDHAGATSAPVGARHA